MSVYTYKGLYDQVLRMLDEAGDTGTTLALAKDLVNQAHQRRCGQQKWSFLLSDVYSFSTVAGRKTYSLHQEFDRPFYFKNTTANDLLIELPDSSLGPTGRLEELTGPASARHFVLWGTSAVREQPATPGTITIVSTASGDTGVAFQVGIKGEDASGNVFAEVLQLSGTTPVSGVATFAKVLSVTKSQEFGGTLTVSSGATTLLQLLGWEMGRQYPQLTLLETPEGAGETIEYRFYRKPLVLVNDYDVPDIPAPHSQILVWDALIAFSGYNQDADAMSTALWREQQKALEEALYQHYLERQTLEAGVRYVRWVGDL